MPQVVRGKMQHRTPETARLMAEVVRLRRMRTSYPDVASTLGISLGYAHKLYNIALSEIPAAQIDEHRAEETMLIDDAIHDLLKIARDEEGQGVSHRSRIEAWSVIRAWAERKAKLLGLDAPTQTVSIDKIDQEIMSLTRELEAMADLGDEVPVEMSPELP